MKVITGEKFCIAALALLAATQAQGRSLCGQSYRSVAELKATLRGAEDSDVFDGMRVLTVARNHTLWWFTKPSHPAYPAVACVRQVARDQGLERLPVQYACGSVPKKACAALAQQLSTAKF